MSLAWYHRVTSGWLCKQSIRICTFALVASVDFACMVPISFRAGLIQGSTSE